LLTNTPPFDGESLGEIFVKIVEGAYFSLEDLGVTAPPGLEAVIDKCLQIERGDRFANTGEIALALAPFASPAARKAAQHVADTSKRIPRSLFKKTSQRQFQLNP
jgi:eukaryotic-like serine/threonine-protein kinase